MTPFCIVIDRISEHQESKTVIVSMNSLVRPHLSILLAKPLGQRISRAISELTRLSKQFSTDCADDADEFILFFISHVPSMLHHGQNSSNAEPILHQRHQRHLRRTPTCLNDVSLGVNPLLVCVSLCYSVRCNPGTTRQNVAESIRCKGGALWK
jgi:hypothetical protein